MQVIQSTRFGSSASPSSWSGTTFGASGITNNISGPTRTYTKGAGNSGNVRFDSVFFNGSGLTYIKNGAAGVNITEGLVITLVSTDTLAIRAAGLTSSGLDAGCDVVDVDGGTGANCYIVRS